jgi:NADPH:quinone reductase-like Zn-dependent oxidoreductase
LGFDAVYIRNLLPDDPQKETRVQVSQQNCDKKQGDMKAIVCSEYGSPDLLRCVELEKPVPRDREVLIRVQAASVNPLDYHLIKGKPYSMRLLFGLRKPRDPRMGRDVAGLVEATGTNVTQFKKGDEVYGSCRGALAEYACASEMKLALKPKTVTFEQAASLPVVAYTALQGLRDVGHIRSGQSVLINGAAGGVGTLAVQIARYFGAEVTGVCSTRSVEMVQSLGASRVIDYTREDFTKSRHRFDLIFDCVSNHSLSSFRRLLNPNGIYIMVGAPKSRWLIGLMAPALQARIMSWFVSQKLTTLMARSNSKDLEAMNELMASGKVSAVIDRSYSLEETPEAIRYLQEDHAHGKVVIRLQ